MDDHLSRTALARVFSGLATQPEVDAAIPHAINCRRCWELATKVVEELRRERALFVHRSDARAALLTLLEEEQRQALDHLRARGWWAELKTLPQEDQLERIRSVAALRTRGMFETVLGDASTAASDDPHPAEETALTAHALAGLLSGNQCSRELKSDLQGEAMIVVANCRRLAADWSGSQAALKEARACLRRGTGDPVHEARLLSISASLASDTGNLEVAQRRLAQAAALYRAGQDVAGLASIAVQEASALLAGLRFDEAIARAEEALRVLAPPDARLEMLARSIVTECLIELGRPTEALRSHQATWPLYRQLGGRRDQLKVAYLDARLLDAFECVRESEKCFRAVIDACIDEELYKDAFIFTLTFFDSLYKRGALGKAEQVCEEASRLLAAPLCHAQMRQVWEDLLTQVRSQALTARQILAARLYFLRHWSVPAARLPVPNQGADAALEISASLVLEELEAAAEPEPLPPQPARRMPTAAEEEPLLDPPSLPFQLGAGGYQEALDRYDRQLIAVAIEHCGGSFRAAARLLGISRNTFRAKVKRYGLAGEDCH